MNKTVFHRYSTLVKLSNFGLNTGFTHVEVQVRSGWNWNGSNCSIHSLDPVNFLFVSSKLSLCGFGLDCEIGLRDQRSCFWDFADFKRIQIEPYSRKDHLEIILTNEKTNWPIVEQEQFQQKRFLLITRGQAQDNTTVNPQATRLISRQLLKLFNVNFEIIVWIVWVVYKIKKYPQCDYKVVFWQAQKLIFS